MKRKPKYTSHNDLGARVRRLADLLQMSMGDVAVKLKMSRPHLYGILSGRTKEGPGKDRLRYWLSSHWFSSRGLV